MNKKALVVLAILLIAGVSIAVAGGGIGEESLPRRDSTIELSKERKQALTTAGITTPQNTEISCNGKTCEFQIYQLKADGNILWISPPIRFADESLPTAELEAKRNELAKERLEQYADAKTRQAQRGTDTPALGGGRITIRETPKP